MKSSKIQDMSYSRQQELGSVILNQRIPFVNPTCSLTKWLPNPYQPMKIGILIHNFGTLTPLLVHAGRRSHRLASKGKVRKLFCSIDGSGLLDGHFVEHQGWMVNIYGEYL